eukprot:CAMPEP_0181236810 /NCGR_PEP_ID=MMETSP1096-20121128/38394_1 /TAXON_ID=156174 ORGANISM="Chrysochromulina ericina, Strain CCMP281" /NCGR_SAMPLE_ID=MMETSP1096 /ASSEMBLY_ACC=CAM_ASM_000453 /LENGTH=107 /DNA_ID=CAMNT_0023332055 /DNA_START=565 /DNA_END=889 /DNA_ORIENTATION=-
MARRPPLEGKLLSQKEVALLLSPALHPLRPEALLEPCKRRDEARECRSSLRLALRAQHAVIGAFHVTTPLLYEAVDQSRIARRVEPRVAREISCNIDALNKDTPTCL